MKTLHSPTLFCLCLLLLPLRLPAQPTPSGKVAPIRILAASTTPLTDKKLITWEASRGFSGGQIITRTLPGLAEIYQSERYGDFSFAESLQNGKYRVTLHLCESAYKSWDEARGKRSFDITVENSRTNIKDLSRDAGGFLKPLVKVYEVTVRDGILNISFKATPRDPANFDPGCLNAIEIEWLSKQTGFRVRGEKVEQVELYKD